MIRAIDVAWAAGFLEGEGSFYNYGTPVVTVAQVQREPIERMEKLFGGSSNQRITKGFSGKNGPPQPIWVWKAPAYRSIEIMMTVYSLMSPKRQSEIKDAIEKWKAARPFKRKGFHLCARGHRMTEDNQFRSAGRMWCRACKNQKRKEWRAERKRLGLPNV